MFRPLAFFRISKQSIQLRETVWKTVLKSWRRPMAENLIKNGYNTLTWKIEMFKILLLFIFSDIWKFAWKKKDHPQKC